MEASTSYRCSASRASHARSPILRSVAKATAGRRPLAVRAGVLSSPIVELVPQLRGIAPTLPSSPHLLTGSDTIAEYLGSQISAVAAGKLSPGDLRLPTELPSFSLPTQLPSISLPAIPQLPALSLPELSALLGDVQVRCVCFPGCMRLSRCAACVA